MRYLVIGLVCLLLTGGCITAGPVDWRWDQHLMTLKTCRIACHPRGMLSYDAIDGECQCATSQLKKRY